MGRCKDRLNDNECEAKAFNCNICSFNTTSKATFTSHRKMHQGPSFNCDLCDYKSKVQGNLIVHKEAVHFKTKRYKCDKCEFETSLITNVILLNTKTEKYHA